MGPPMQSFGPPQTSMSMGPSGPPMQSFGPPQTSMSMGPPMQSMGPPMQSMGPPMQSMGPPMPDKMQSMGPPMQSQPGNNQWISNVARPQMTQVQNPPVTSGNIQYGPSYSMQYQKRSTADKTAVKYTGFLPLEGVYE